MKCVAIISCSESSLFGDGVTLRSGGMMKLLGNGRNGKFCSKERGTGRREKVDSCLFGGKWCKNHWTMINIGEQYLNDVLIAYLGFNELL